MQEENIATNQPKQEKLMVNELVQVSVDRTMKGVKNLINALQNAESIYYPNRAALIDLYANATDLDGHLHGIINKRIDAVLNKELQYIGSDKKEVEGFEKLLSSEAFRDLCKNILLTKFYGVTGMEFIPAKELEFEDIPRKHIKIEQGIIATNQSDYEGKAYNDITNVWIIGKKKDYGLLLKVVFYAILKKGGFGDYAQYVEIFGQPVRVGKYDANDDKTRIELKKALVDAGGSLAIMIPKQAEFEIMDGKISNGNGELQEKFINTCNNEMSIAILGNTETTSNSNGGSNAKAKEQGKQQLEITKSDMAYLLSHLNSNKCFQILKSYNLPVVVGGLFKFEKEVDLIQLSQKIIIDTQVAERVPIGDDYFYETYHIPKPDNYNELKKKQENNEQANNNTTNNPKPQTLNKEKQAKKAKQENLTAWQNLMAKLADFFDPAHKD